LGGELKGLGMVFWPSSCLVKGIAFQEEYKFEGYVINPKDGIPFRSMLKILRLWEYFTTIRKK
jgi:hypothetical protein